MAADQPGEFEPLSGDDLERIDAVGACYDSEFVALVQTALFHRQEAMDLRDERERLRGALGVALPAMEILREKCVSDEARSVVQQGLDIVKAALA